MKPLRFVGASKNDLSRFPDDVRSRAGHDLYRVQEGFEPQNWKPISTVGAGAREIRVQTADGAFRVIYVAAFASAIYVIHVFHKKTHKTSRHDIEVARRRYREAARLERDNEHG